MPLLLLLLYWARVSLLFAGPPSTLLRPLLVTVTLGLSVGVATSLLVRRSPVAEIGGALFGALVVSLPWAIAICLLIGAYYIANELLHRWGRNRLDAATMVAGSGNFLAIFVAVLILSLPVSGAVALSDFNAPPEPAVIAGDRPNIYVLLLDARARSDTMATLFQEDDSGFLGSLAALGFDLYPDSTSNYNATELTLLSMFTGRYASDYPQLSPGVGDGSQQARAARRAYAGSSLIGQFRGQGYEIVSVAPPVAHVRFPDANTTIDPGGLSDLEVNLLSSSAAGGLLLKIWPDFVLDSERSHVKESLNALSSLARSPGPHLVLDHVISPHQPFLWDEDGNSLPTPNCFPGCNLWEGDTHRAVLELPDFKSEYRSQVEYLNDLVLRSVSAVVDSDPTAILVIMGDHGSRLDKTDTHEAFRNFFAARTPGAPGLFGTAPTPINALPHIADAYLGLDIGMSPARHFFVPELSRILEYETVGDIDGP